MLILDRQSITKKMWVRIEKKRKYGATQEKAAGTELSRILLAMRITFGAKQRTGEERKPRGTTLFAGAGCAGRPFKNLVGFLQNFQKILPTTENLKKVFAFFLRAKTI